MSPRKNPTPAGVDKITAQSTTHLGVWLYGRHHQITPIIDAFTQAAELADLADGPLLHLRALEARAQELLEQIAAGKQAARGGTPWAQAVLPPATEYCQVRAELDQWRRNTTLIEDEGARLAQARLYTVVNGWAPHTRHWCHSIITELDAARITRQPEPNLPDGLTEEQARELAAQAYVFDASNPEAVANSEGGWHDPEHGVYGSVYLTQ